MKNLIYAYKIKSNQKIVYVGQTHNLDQRRKQHEIYDVANPHQPEYNYPLSRGIRKYGIDYYECIILEETEDLDNREKYWIQYYDTYHNGYNQTEGGQLGKYIYFSDDIIMKAIHLLKTTSLSFEEISKQTGIAIVTLSEINHGKRRFQPNETYPLRELTRGKKITQENLLMIKELLEHSQEPMTKIAQRFNVCVATIRKINKGERQVQANWQYPLRKKNTWKY